MRDKRSGRWQQGVPLGFDTRIRSDLSQPRSSSCLLRRSSLHGQMRIYKYEVLDYQHVMTWLVCHHLDCIGLTGYYNRISRVASRIAFQFPTDMQILKHLRQPSHEGRIQTAHRPFSEFGRKMTTSIDAGCFSSRLPLSTTRGKCTYSGTQYEYIHVG